MATLPEAPNLEWLRKQAKHGLAEMRRSRPAARLADAQRELAREYGFPSWRALKAHVESLTLPGQLFQAARAGEAARVATILDANPQLLLVREPPHEWTLLHAAAQMGQLGVVDVLLARGFDVNTKERGDNTTALHWAAAAGRVDVVRRLLDAGVDPVGAGDDHELTAIGWTSCWHGTDSPAHREIIDLLLRAGARHTIFSAIGANDASALRRIVGENPAALEQRMSRNEGHRRPLHHAVSLDRVEMVRVLLELGADPHGTDDSGTLPVAYSAHPGGAPETVLALSGGKVDDVYTALVLRNHERAADLVLGDRASLDGGVLHMMARRNDADAVRWLLARGANPNALWNHFGSMLTAMHIAATLGNMEMLALLLDAGGDPAIRDSLHEGDVAGWAEHHGHTDMIDAIKKRWNGK